MAVISGDSDDNVLIGTVDSDLIRGFEGNDHLEGRTGGDSLMGDAGADELFGESGDDFLNAGDDDDYLDGGTGVDNLFGGDGADTMIGGGGADFMTGEDGDDEFYVLSGDGFSFDYFSGGSGSDILVSEQDVYAENIFSIETIGILGNGNIYFDGSDQNVDFAGVTMNTVIEVQGGDGNDTLKDNEDGRLTEGGNGDDNIDGRGGDDDLIGDAGADSLTGGDGDDILSGGDGDDVVDGGAGADILSGGTGFDLLAGGSGDDIYVHQDIGVSYIVEASGASDILVFDDDISNIFFQQSGADLLIYSAADAADSVLDTAVLVQDFFTGGIGNANVVEYVIDSNNNAYSTDFLF